MKVLLLDYDGTLVDTNELLADGTHAAIHYLTGTSLPRRLIRGDESTREILERFSIPQRIAGKVRELKFQFYLQHLHRIVPRESLNLFLWKLFLTRRARIAVVTNSPAVVVGQGLVHAELSWPMLEAVYCGDLVPERGKPHPDIYVFALKKLGVKPHDCVVFEDSDVGMEAARAAKIEDVRQTSYARLEEDLRCVFSSSRQPGMDSGSLT